MRRRPMLKFRPGLERLDQKQLLKRRWVDEPCPRLEGLGPPRGRTVVGSPDGRRHHQSQIRFAHPFPGVPHHKPVVSAPCRSGSSLSTRPGSIGPAGGRPGLQRALCRREEWDVPDFRASNRFTVRMTNQPRSDAFPILTGTQQWKPKQWIVLYILTKKYYPVSPVAGGFQLDLNGRSSTLVPGPSGIFLRLPYNPWTFARTLNWIVAYGPGASRVRVRKLACLTQPSTRSSPQERTGSISAGISRPRYSRIPGASICGTKV